MLLIAPNSDRTFPSVAGTTFTVLNEFQSTFSLVQVSTVPLDFLSTPLYAIDNIQSASLKG
jgi:hypothetical protein